MARLSSDQLISCNKVDGSETTHAGLCGSWADDGTTCSGRLVCRPSSVRCGTTISISGGSYHSWRRRQIPGRRHITVTGGPTRPAGSAASRSRRQPIFASLPPPPASDPLSLRSRPILIEWPGSAGQTGARDVDWFNINRTGQRRRGGPPPARTRAPGSARYLLPGRKGDLYYSPFFIHLHRVAPA